MNKISNFIRKHEKGVIFLDEIEKISSDMSDVSAWCASIYVELFSIFDHDQRLLTQNFTQADIDRLRYKYLIVAAGAWQENFKTFHAPRMGFHNNSNSQNFAQFLTDKSGIPDELLYRFSPPVEIAMPTEEDFIRGITSIHTRLGIMPPEPDVLQKLGKEGVAAKRGVRFLELYLSDLLSKDARLLENFSPPCVEKSRSALKIFEMSKLRDEFLIEFRKLGDLCRTFAFELYFIREAVFYQKVFTASDGENVRWYLFKDKNSKSIMDRLEECAELSHQFAIDLVQNNTREDEVQLITLQTYLMAPLVELLKRYPVFMRELNIYSYAGDVVNSFRRVIELYNLMMKIPV